jgi:hypothetical protein
MPQLATAAVPRIGTWSASPDRRASPLATAFGVVSTVSFLPPQDQIDFSRRIGQRHRRVQQR